MELVKFPFVAVFSIVKLVFYIIYYAIRYFYISIPIIALGFVASTALPLPDELSVPATTNIKVVVDPDDLRWSHADEKHEEEAVRARKCLRDFGPDFVVLWAKKGKAMQLCWHVREQTLYVRIVTTVTVGTGKDRVVKWVEVTAFQWKETAMNNIEDVLELANNSLGKYGEYSFIKPGWELLEIKWRYVSVAILSSFGLNQKIE